MVNIGKRVFKYFSTKIWDFKDLKLPNKKYENRKFEVGISNFISFLVVVKSNYKAWWFRMKVAGEL